MHCTRCGTPVEPHFRYCRQCGAAVEGEPDAPLAAPAARAEPRMATHVRVLGWLLIGVGVLIGLGATAMFVGAGVMQMAPVRIGPGPNPDWIVSAMTLIGLLVAGTAGLCVASGIGLLNYEGWARFMALAVGLLLVFNFPFGTAIAVYAGWVLLSEEGRVHYQRRGARAG